MRTLIKFYLVILFALFSACQGKTAEEALPPKDFVRWSRDQNITIDQFKGEGPPNDYLATFGIYFIYDLKGLPDNFRFDVITGLDRKRSYAGEVGEVNEGTDLFRHKILPVLFKLKFDYYEIHARKFRKYLIEHKSEFKVDSDELMRNLSGQNYDEAFDGWEKINQDIESGDKYSQKTFDSLRNVIDGGLDKYKEFDASVNNYN